MTFTLEQKSYENEGKIPLEYRITNIRTLCNNKRRSLNFRISKKETLDFKSECCVVCISDFGLFDLQKIANG